MLLIQNFFSTLMKLKFNFIKQQEHITKKILESFYEFAIVDNNITLPKSQLYFQKSCIYF